MGMIVDKILVWYEPFRATGLFLYPLTTSENLWFSNVSRGYEKIPAAWNGLKCFKYFAENYQQKTNLITYE